MKTIRNSFLMLVAVAAVVSVPMSCTQKSIEIETAKAVEMQTVTLTAGIASETQTKTAIGEQVEGSKFYKVIWSEGDKIGAVVNVDGTETIYPMTLTSGAGTEEGTFEGQIPEGATISKAIYPYVEGGSATIKNEQTATPGSFDPTVALMEATRNGENKLVFAHKAAYVKLIVDCTYSQITINLGSDYTITPASGQIAANTDYYIAVPAAEYDNFTLLFNTGTLNLIKSSSKGFALAEGKIINLGKFSLSDVLSDIDPINL